MLGNTNGLFRVFREHRQMIIYYDKFIFIVDLRTHLGFTFNLKEIPVNISAPLLKKLFDQRTRLKRESAFKSMRTNKPDDFMQNSVIKHILTLLLNIYAIEELVKKIESFNYQTDNTHNKNIIAKIKEFLQPKEKKKIVQPEPVKAVKKPITPNSNPTIGNENK